MHRFVIFLMCIFLSVSVMAETVYKKTNPDGSVIFTDKNVVDSKEIKIRKTTTYSPMRLPSLTLPRKKLSPTFNYEIAITKPVNDSTILGHTNITVSVFIQPVLKIGYGHQLRYQLAGQTVVSQNLTEIFENIPRGTHIVSVSIVDKNGVILGSKASSRFHIKRFFIRRANP